MPLPIDISDLFTGRVVEWARLEFKDGWNPGAALKTICAFANDFHNRGGGYLVFGVEEKDGRPVLPPKGLEAAQVDAIQKKLLELGRSAIQPAYYPLVVPTMAQCKVSAQGGQARPYKAQTCPDNAAVDRRETARRSFQTVLHTTAPVKNHLSRA